MESTGTLRRAALLAIVLALAVAAGCSKSDNGGYSSPTAPGPGKELASGTVASGAHFAHTFTAAGNYPYHCGIHPTIMFGDKVVVSDTAAATSASVSIVSATTPGFNPPTVSVRTGGTVTWTNADGMAHSVESD